MEKLASSVALAEHEQEAGPARPAKTRQVRPARNTPRQPGEADLALEAATALVEDMKPDPRCIAVRCGEPAIKTREQADQER
jgi:hypothetical protein